jgi:hypothetical protein
MTGRRLHHEIAFVEATQPVERGSRNDEGGAAYAENFRGSLPQRFAGTVSALYAPPARKYPSPALSTTSVHR